MICYAAQSDKREEIGTRVRCEELAEGYIEHGWWNHPIFLCKKHMKSARNLQGGKRKRRILLISGCMYCNSKGELYTANETGDTPVMWRIIQTGYLVTTHCEGCSKQIGDNEPYSIWEDGIITCKDCSPPGK